MGKFTRRDFLKAAAAGAGAMTLSAFLEACGKVLPTSVLPVETKAPDTPATFPRIRLAGNRRCD